MMQKSILLIDDSVKSFFFWLIKYLLDRTKYFHLKLLTTFELHEEKKAI